MGAMKRPRKPAKNSANDAEARRTNVLLEFIRKDISAVAEAVSGLTTRFETFERRLAKLEEEVGLMRVILQDIEGRLTQLEKDFKGSKETFDKRLSTVEAKLTS